MDYASFLNSISFRLLQPGARQYGYWRLARALPRACARLEIANTRLPGVPGAVRDRLKELCLIPRMSTYAIAAMIQRGVAQMPADACYVNVGVWHGFTLLAGMAGNPDRRCIGVDNFSEFGGPRAAFLERFGRRKGVAHEFFDMDYREYFARVHRGSIGFYLYDGDHSYGNQLEGLRVAEPFFAPGCIVMVDDTNFAAAHRALADFVARSPHRYEALLDRHTASNEHPTLWNGVTLVRRAP